MKNYFLKKLYTVLILSMGMVSVVFAQSGSEIVETAREAESLMSLLIQGGLVMIPIFLISILMLTLAMERFISLSRGKVVPRDFFKGFKEEVGLDSPDLAKGRQYCLGRDSATAHVLRAGMLKWGESVDYLDKTLSDASGAEIGRMKRSLRSFKLIASIAPLLGLLGTVTGMIRAFQTVALSTSSLGKPELLAKGIYEAMVTTASGLVVAIPALVIYAVLSNRVDKFGDDLEKVANGFLDFYRRHRGTATNIEEEEGEAAVDNDSQLDVEEPAMARSGSAL